MPGEDVHILSPTFALIFAVLGECPLLARLSRHYPSVFSGGIHSQNYQVSTMFVCLMLFFLLCSLRLSSSVASEYGLIR